MSEEYLVLLDTDRIKNYIFATNKLKEIRGASSILDELNKEETKRLFNSLDGKKIFLAGGSGKIKFKDKDNAKTFVQELKKLYHTKTNDQASISTATIPYTKSDFENVIYLGEKKLRQKKDSKYLRFQPLTNNYFKICESTGLLPAEIISIDDGRLISQASQDKRQHEKDHESVFFGKFKQFFDDPVNTKLRDNYKNYWRPLFSQEIKKLLPEDFNDIGELSSNYIGLIYADGNRMGQRLQELKDEGPYKRFSDAIEKATQHSIFDSIIKNELKMEKFKFPFEILLLGGDDLILVVPANKAVEIAIEFCKTFKKLTKQYLDDLSEQFPEGISISAGVVIAHDKYPIHRMIDHAEQLLKSAKSLSNKNRAAEICSIDFMVVKGSLLNELTEIRKTELSYSSDDNIGSKEDIKLYYRPYKIEDIQKLIDSIRKFKKCDFPRNKLISLYHSMYRGKYQAMLDAFNVLSRLSQGDGNSKDVLIEFWKKDWGLDFFPWKHDNGDYRTPLLDLIELYDFIDEK